MTSHPGFITAQRVLALAAGLTMMVLIGGWGQLDRPAGTGDPATARAIRAVTSGEPVDASRLPAGFAAVMGYRPVVRRHQLTRADGGCSSPFGGTPYHFTAACRQHDLGYDLLRYANRTGAPLGPWARKAVDARFAEQTQGRCHQLGCWVVGGFYTGMVRFNSWRQGYGPPVFEPLARLLVPVGGGLVTAVLLIPWSRPRIRPDRPGETPLLRSAVARLLEVGGRGAGPALSTAPSSALRAGRLQHSDRLSLECSQTPSLSPGVTLDWSPG